jgi:hypothetical protein
MVLMAISGGLGNSDLGEHDRKGVEDARRRAIADYAHAWLFPTTQTQVAMEREAK